MTSAGGFSFFQLLKEVNINPTIKHPFITCSMNCIPITSLLYYAIEHDEMQMS